MMEKYPTLHTMYQNYQHPRAVYYVVELDGNVVGGAGIKQLDGSNDNICELQRMFLIEQIRGKGMGRVLMDQCLTDAKTFGYSSVYLETLGNMQEAITFYHKYGFKDLSQSLGDTGHSGCNVWMLLTLD